MVIDSLRKERTHEREAFSLSDVYESGPFQ